MGKTDNLVTEKWSEFLIGYLTLTEGERRTHDIAKLPTVDWCTENITLGGELLNLDFLVGAAVTTPESRGFGIISSISFGENCYLESSAGSGLWR